MTAALPYIFIASTALSAVGSVQAGRAQARGLMAQAQQSAEMATMRRTQARSEVLKYKQQGVEVLNRIIENDAAIVARAGAGGIDPFSGSARSLQQFALSKGAGELYMGMDNAIIQDRMGELAALQYEEQAGQLAAQAGAAKRAGVFNAIATIGTAAATYGMLGSGPTPKPETPLGIADI